MDIQSRTAAGPAIFGEPEILQILLDGNIFSCSFGNYLCPMNDPLLQNWEKKAADHQKQYRQFLNRADKNKVLKALPALHEEAFEKIDCLQCANCCRNYSPRFKTPDIKR